MDVIKVILNDWFRWTWTDTAVLILVFVLCFALVTILGTNNRQGEEPPAGNLCERKRSNERSDRKAEQEAGKDQG